jgi:adenylate cyclase
MSEATPLQGGRADAIGDLLQTLGRAPFDLDAVLATILHQAVGLCGADRGFIYLLEDGWYHHAADVGATPEMAAFNREHPIRPTRGTLTGRTVLERRPVHIPDVLADPAYDYAEAQRLGGFRAMLGVPMLRNDVVVGVLALWRDLPRPFTSAEIELVTQFSDGAAIAIELTRLTKTIDRQRSELSRYVSPQVAGLVTSDEGERLLAGHRREITVVFCDLRGFTAFSESAAPEDVLSVLRMYHEVLGARMAEFEGTLERFTGDGIMAFFNDPIEQPDHAERAVRMAVAVRGDVASLVEAWLRSGFELGLGIGIATGYATLGRIGFRDRVDYAAIGTVVNLAARLCAEATHQQILLPARTHALVESIVEVTPRGDIAMKGCERPVRVVEVIALAADGHG